MLLLLAIASAAPVETAAKATVRIEHPARIGARDWPLVPEAQRRELIVRDEQGRTLLLRLVENQ